MRLHSIRIQMIVPTALLALILAGLLLFMLSMTRIQQEAIERQAAHYFEAVSVVLNADRDIYQALVAQQRLMNKEGNADKNQVDFDENAQQVNDRFQKFRFFLADEPELLTPFASFDQLYREWVQASQSLHAASRATQPSAGNPAEIAQARTTANERFTAIRKVLDQAGEATNTHARSQKQAVQEKIALYERGAIVVIVLAFVIALITGYYIPLRLTRNVQRISRRIKEIAEGNGDLTQRINFHARDELGDLAREFDGFVEHLRAIISAIQTQSVTLGGMTGQLDTVSRQAGRISAGLVSSSDAMVSAGQQMNASNQQMANLAKGTADEANLSSQLTHEGVSAVNLSNQSIERLVADIEQALERSTDLEQSSAAIVSVLEVIRTIADQTNLLALNAAIEAARAGEQGRGFAVVADEVRTLATRTQESTREIEAMIERLKNSVVESSTAIRSSRDNARTTMEQINQVITVFGTLSTSFDRVQTMATHTAQTTDEQARASHHIRENLLALKEQTDGVSSMSDEVQSQSRQISGLYQALSSQVERFRV
ncbi:methyl-accepting chemotaxis protein [Pseudomonas syringae]|nr:methyl-accepting chemotaxis protein [Pseudomonas syringae]MBD8574314.1 methyl-accepting chemotaxis protein [Pseudomonas syringae]MBD8791947.1 methyl-accepting chemotaxis protein [Pseudomonas syringae]MBD8801171.1 methyl-accepting chemotaxis protein [Pseudomonas syringae]MBD8813412.1 methyl-accepting chemotaxis protein [Pseudomonas syringae]